MQFMVHMRDGSTFRIEASYIEVVGAGESSYTFLGPVPGYPMAIVASFPLALVAGVVPAARSAGAPVRTGVAAASHAGDGGQAKAPVATGTVPTGTVPTGSVPTGSVPTATAPTATGPTP